MIKYTCRFLNELFKREHPKIYKFYLILSMSFPVHCYKCFILTSTGNGEELSKGWHFSVCEVCLLCDIYIYMTMMTLCCRPYKTPSPTLWPTHCPATRPWWSSINKMKTQTCFRYWRILQGVKKLSYKCPFFISATAAVTRLRCGRFPQAVNNTLD